MMVSPRRKERLWSIPSILNRNRENCNISLILGEGLVQQNDYNKIIFAVEVTVFMEEEGTINNLEHLRLSVVRFIFPDTVVQTQTNGNNRKISKCICVINVEIGQSNFEVNCTKFY